MQRWKCSGRAYFISSSGPSSPSPSHIIDRLEQHGRAAHSRSVHILSSASNVSSRSATAIQGTRFPSKIPPNPLVRSPSSKPVRRPGPPARRRYRNPSCLRGPTDSARDVYSWLARAARHFLLPSYHQPFRLLFGDDLGALQVPTNTERCLA